MKKISILIAIFSISLLSGCATKYTTSNVLDNYTPYNMAPNIQETAILKAVKGTKFWAVDGNRIASIIDVMLGNAHDSIVLPTGPHTISASKGIDLDIGTVNYKAGHEYLLATFQAGKRIHFWIEDKTTNETIWGKKTEQKDYEEK